MSFLGRFLFWLIVPLSSWVLFSCFSACQKFFIGCPHCEVYHIRCNKYSYFFPLGYFSYLETVWALYVLLLSFVSWDQRGLKTTANFPHYSGKPFLGFHLISRCFVKCQVFHLPCLVRTENISSSVHNPVSPLPRGLCLFISLLLSTHFHKSYLPRPPKLGTLPPKLKKFTRL